MAGAGTEVRAGPAPIAPSYYRVPGAESFGFIRNNKMPRPFAATAYQCGAGGWNARNGTAEVCATGSFTAPIVNRGPGRARLMSATEATDTNACRVRMVGPQPLVPAGRTATVTLQVTGTGYCGSGYVFVYGHY